MFTGIIQSIATIEDISYKSNLYKIKTNLNLDNCKKGSSISCDGVCLTIFNIKNIKNVYTFNVNVGEETLKRSNLIFWKKNTVINIEKSLRVGDEISGHFVYGHVDSTVSIKNITKLQNSWKFEFLFTSPRDSLNMKKYIVEKGSVSINGISLTVANVYENSFTVSIIPHTFENTNLFNLSEQDKVNIEFDALARYINKNYDS